MCILSSLELALERTQFLYLLASLNYSWHDTSTGLINMCSTSGPGTGHELTRPRPVLVRLRLRARHAVFGRVFVSCVFCCCHVTNVTEHCIWNFSKLPFAANRTSGDGFARTSHTRSPRSCCCPASTLTLIPKISSVPSLSWTTSWSSVFLCSQFSRWFLCSLLWSLRFSQFFRCGCVRCCNYLLIFTIPSIVYGNNAYLLVSPKMNVASCISSAATSGNTCWTTQSWPTWTGLLCRAGPNTARVCRTWTCLLRWPPHWNRWWSRCRRGWTPWYARSAQMLQVETSAAVGRLCRSGRVCTALDVTIQSGQRTTRASRTCWTRTTPCLRSHSHL